MIESKRFCGKKEIYSNCVITFWEKNSRHHLAINCDDIDDLIALLEELKKLPPEKDYR